MVRALSPALLLALALAAGAAGAREVADDAGRRVQVPDRPQRVFAAGGPASVFVYALAPDRLLGWTRPVSPEEAAYLPPRYAALPEMGRLTGRGGTANVERLLAARADLVVDVGSTAATYASLADQVQAQTGLPWLLYDGRLTHTAATLRSLGAVLGVPTRGEELARHVESTLAQVQERVARVPGERRPRVYYARGPAGLQTARSGSINVEVLDILGARNVAGATGASSGLAQVSLEQVIAWDPEVIVTIDPNFHRLVLKDERWRAVSAVRQGRVHLAPALPFGWFDFPPALNRLLGVRWLAGKLYPAQFPEDIRPFVTDFFARYYHRAPGAAELDALLGTP